VGSARAPSSEVSQDKEYDCLGDVWIFQKLTDSLLKLESMFINGIVNPVQTIAAGCLQGVPQKCVVHSMEKS